MGTAADDRDRILAPVDGLGPISHRVSIVVWPGPVHRLGSALGMKHNTPNRISPPPHKGNTMETLATFFTETYGWPPHIARMEAQHIAQGHPSWPPDRKAAILPDFHAWQARH